MKDDASDDVGAKSDTKQSTNDENQPENVLVIDTTFTCKIVAPGMDPFEIKVRDSILLGLLSLSRISFSNNKEQRCDFTSKV